MLNYWKLKQNKNETQYLILKDDAIWLSTVDENKTSIEKALEEKQLQQTRFLRFSNLANIIFDDNKQNLHFNFKKEKNEPQEKGFKINIPEKNYTEIKNEIESKVNSPLQNLTLLDRLTKPVIISVASTIGVGLFLYISGIGLSYFTILLLIGLTIIEILVFSRFLSYPSNGKILKFK